MSRAEEIKSLTPEIVSKYANRSDLRGMMQVLNTFIPFFVLFYFAIDFLAQDEYLIATLLSVLIALFIVRIFMLMHDCGHKSLFKTQTLNKLFGFFTGVFCGMPQYVWTQHHNYHHATNGNWDKYRGPLSVITVDEYNASTPAQQRRYRFTRSLWFVPVGAFLYFIFNPRFNWIVGSVKLFVHMLLGKLRHPLQPLSEIRERFQTRVWNSRKEYWHMAGNNVVLISIWVSASHFFGAEHFFPVYIFSLTLAGAIGIIIFTIQHNFENSYASDDAHWDYYQASMTGTSYLTLPAIANWFSADIAYHHFHHLSPMIPNYRLAACHKEYGYLFDEVTRIRLRDVFAALRHILWDKKQQKIVSIKAAVG